MAKGNFSALFQTLDSATVAPGHPIEVILGLLERGRGLDLCCIGPQPPTMILHWFSQKWDKSRGQKSP